jgi:hypothetical protein
MADTFSAFTGGLDAPATKGFAITPDDDTDVPSVTRGLYVGGAGTVVVVLAGDSGAVTFVGATAGSVLPIRVKRVLSTGTTATSLVGLY